MPVKKGNIYQLIVKNVAYGGKGLAKLEGFAIFINNTVPGDIVEARVIKKRKNYAEAKIIKILQYSEHRIYPPCPYSGICGGCKWQFLNYSQQLIYKREHVLEAIEHIALIKDIKVNTTIPSDSIFGYRNKMEFSCSDRKWLLETEMDSRIESWFGLGLHVPGTFYKVLDISGCLLQASVGNEILTDTKSFMKKSDQKPYGLRSHDGFWRFLIIRYSPIYNTYMVNIVTTSYDRKTLESLSNLLTSKYTNIVSVINSISTKKSGVAVGEYEILLAGKNTLRDRIGHYNFDISANSFFQTNTLGAKKLYDVVKAFSDLSGNELVLDLYCGIGTMSIYLSNMARKVIGVDIVKSAILDAKKNCELNGIKNCNFILGDVKDKIYDFVEIPDVIIIDPPRSGMHAKVVKKILNILPERIVYISCNPTTLARDLLELKKFYEVEVIQPVDMFPHTFHIEVVVKLNKKK